MKYLVTIEKLINGGKGLARLENGMVVMIPFVLPGEEMEVAAGKKFSGHMEAEVIQILQPSEQRKKALCPYYGTCGGCDLQHCSYAMQQSVKKEIIGELLQRTGMECQDSVFQDMIPASITTSYRNRVRLKLSTNCGPGFFRVRSNTVVPIASCLVATASINKAIGEFSRNREMLQKLAESCDEFELLYSPANGKLVGLLHLLDKKKHDWASLNDLAGLEILDDLLVQSGKKIVQVNKNRTSVVLKQEFTKKSNVESYTLSWSAGCFSQVNGEQNEQLVELVCKLCGPLTGKRVLDLYCGIGNFTVPLALLGAHGIGVEFNSRSLHWASLNMIKAGINMQGWDFLSGDVRDLLRDLQQKKDKFDCIVCDPPRTGLGKSASQLAALEPERVVYVSCDSATLVRDLKVLSGAGYRVDSVTPVDMFPQTHHIESVTLLKKN